MAMKKVNECGDISLSINYYKIHRYYSCAKSNYAFRLCKNEYIQYVACYWIVLVVMFYFVLDDLLL